MVRRLATAVWLQDTPHTVVKCFEHDVEVVGSPIRQAPYRFKGVDAKDLEA